MVEFYIHTSLASPDFKYPFDGMTCESLHLPQRGDLFKRDGIVYKVQDVMHKQGGSLPSIYLWQYAA